MGKILSVCNQKGGVGKTTVSVNLNAGLARESQKILLVDAGPQGSMNASLGFAEPDDIGRTLATVMEELMEDKEINSFDGILHHEEGVDLIPANIELAGVDVALVNAIGRETVMRSYLDELRDSFDWIIIDCMPSLGMLTINPLAAADEVIIPCSVAYLSEDGWAISLEGAIGCYVRILLLWCDYITGMMCAIADKKLSLRFWIMRRSARMGIPDTRYSVPKVMLYMSPRLTDGLSDGRGPF